MIFWNQDETVEHHTLHPWAAVALLMGAAAGALGIWALLRIGIDTQNLFAPNRSVLGLHHTPTLAIGELAFGILLVGAGMSRLFGRAFMALLGIAASAFGVVVLAGVWHSQLRHWTAVHDNNGWVSLATGIITFGAATLLPTVTTRRVRTEHTTEGHHHRWPRGHAHA